jgi:hypothetical protein
MLALPIGRNEGQVTQANSNEVQHAKQQREKGTIGIMSQVKFNFKGVNSKTEGLSHRNVELFTVDAALVLPFSSQSSISNRIWCMVVVSQESTSNSKSHLTTEIGEQNRIRMKSNFVTRPRVNTQLHVHSSASNQAAQANVLY